MARSGAPLLARLAEYVGAGLHTRLMLAALLVVCASPAAAQVDFSGQWAPVYHEDNPERIPGPELADYTGLPLNDAARLQADSWDADRISVVSPYQCRPHSSDYGMRGLGNLRVWAELDDKQQLVAFRTYMPAWGSERTIWMDGRPHPPEYAEHTFQGFSTGVWEGNMLTITTTHQKTNYYRRNGVPASDRRTVVEHWTRHAEFLTVVTVVTDPVFLTEPLVRSQNWFNDVGQALPQFTCEYAAEVPGAQKVPNHLPGANPYLTEFADWYGLELAATRGGAETMYPEYRQKMGPPHSKPPDRCQRYCTCGGGFNCDVNPPRPPAK
jgi:hypothetical protein